MMRFCFEFRKPTVLYCRFGGRPGLRFAALFVAIVEVWEEGLASRSYTQPCAWASQRRSTLRAFGNHVAL